MVYTQSFKLSKEQIHQFFELGYVILESVIPDDHLELLREECDRLLALAEEKMEQEEKKSEKLNVLKNRYFFCAYRDSEIVQQFLFSDLTEEICRALVGSNAYLFYESFVVKYPKVGLPFGWHQDSGYLNYEHKPYVTCWCPLDDVSEENGTIYVLDYKKSKIRHKQAHTNLNGTPEKIGYFGDNPGVPLVMPAGSIALLSSTVFHRSGPNTSNGMRRAYLADFSPEPILSDDRTKIRALAELFLQDGHRVR